MTGKKKRRAKHNSQKPARNLPVPTAQANPAAAPNHSIHVARAEMFSGPVPHPDLLRQFGEIIPDGANRMMKEAEAQGAHRREIEKLVVESDVRRANLGLYFGFILGLVFGLGGLIDTLQAERQDADDADPAQLRAGGGGPGGRGGQAGADAGAKRRRGALN